MPRWIQCIVFMVFFVRLVLLNPDRSFADQCKRDIPNAARAILVKAGKLMNDKDYAKAIAFLVDFQAQATAGVTEETDRKDISMLRSIRPLAPVIYSTINSAKQPAALNVPCRKIRTFFL